ncbi:DUF2934 domain-containing protein [Pseudomonas borbori]
MSIDEKRVREFAYQIWESEGRPTGQEAKHWEMAKKLAQAEAQGERQPAPRARKVSKPKEVTSAAPGAASKSAEEKPALLKKPKTSAKAPAAKPAKTPKA